MTIKDSFFLSIRAALTLAVLSLSLSGFAQNNKPAEAGQDMTILSDSATLTKGDYLVHLQKVFETVNKVPVTVGSYTKLKPITEYLTRDETAIALLKTRLTQKDKNLNLQNLQMDQTLLKELQVNNRDCLADLDEFEKDLRELKTEILNLRKDTVLAKLFTTPSLRPVFKDQFGELKVKAKVMDSLLKTTTATINDLQARTSANLINIKELIISLKAT